MSRRNNVGSLRLVLALAVLFAHSFPLSSRGSHDPAGPYIGYGSLGSLAVNGFFLLSGYLITASWLHSKSAADYVRRRVLRIYPGYLVALAFTVAVAFAAAPHPAEYLRHLYTRAGDGLKAILFLDSRWPASPTTFTSNPVPGAPNGSLWTLQPELFCYALVAGFGSVGLLTRRWVAVAAAALYAGLVAQLFLEIPLTDWRLLTYFAIGSAVALHGLPRFSPVGVALALFVVSASIAHSQKAFQIVAPVAGSYLLLALAFAAPPAGSDFFARWDLSYGVYLYAFPVQQLLVWQGVSSPWQLFALALPATLLLALLSWVLVERPAARRKPPD